MLDKIALLLAIVGGLNWGLMGIFQLDAVAWLFGGQGSIFSRVIYTGRIGCDLVCIPVVPSRTTG